MANYIIDPEILDPFLPAHTRHDNYNGNVYLSLVGFMFCNTRLLGIKIPYHINFEEVNLRFYVRFNDSGIQKRGTVFIKEIVPRPAISLIANTLYHENYVTKKMKHSFDASAGEINLGYHWKHRNKWNRLEATVVSDALSMLPGSEEAFIAEHYWGYSRFNAKTSFEYAVQHPAWKVHPVKNYSIDCDFTAVYGEAFAFLQNAIPHSVFMAEGSAVTVLHKRRL